MDFVLPGGKSIRLLAPFADMLNHSSEVNQALSCLRCLVWKSFYPCRERLWSRRSGMCVLFSDGDDRFINVGTFRLLSIMDPFRIIAFCVSMALSYPVILTTAMTSFLQRTLARPSSSKSRSSGYRLDSMRPVPSPSLSPIRCRKMFFDTSVFGERTNRVSLS